MSTQEIADRLATLCKTGEWEKAQKELYADDVVSIEPFATPAFEKETKGLENVLEKGRKFDAMVEAMHNITVSQPLVAGNAISFKLDLDITMKGRGQMNMNEICVYTVKDGKVVSEQFFM